MNNELNFNDILNIWNKMKENKFYIDNFTEEIDENFLKIISKDKKLKNYISFRLIKKWGVIEVTSKVFYRKQSRVYLSIEILKDKMVELIKDNDLFQHYSNCIRLNIW